MIDAGVVFWTGVIFGVALMTGIVICLEALPSRRPTEGFAYVRRCTSCKHILPGHSEMKLNYGPRLCPECGKDDAFEQVAARYYPAPNIWHFKEMSGV